jgi:thioredoxin 1
MKEVKMVINFTDDNFDDEVIKTSLPVIVDFYADWCGPCKIISPIIEEISNEYEGKLKVGKVNINDNRATSFTYGIKSIPTVLFFKNGKVAQKVIGAVQKDELIEKVNLVL